MQQLVVSDGMVRGGSTVSEWWDVDHPQMCNDLGDEDFPCGERAEIEVESCRGCWPAN